MYPSLNSRPSSTPNSKPSPKPRSTPDRASALRRRVLPFLATMCLVATPHLARAATPTTTTLAITANAQPVSLVAPRTILTLTATVTSGGTPVHPGQVTFCDAAVAFCTDIHALGTAQLTVNGTATLRFAASLGNHSYKAIFLGTQSFTASTSSAQGLAVTTTALASTITLTSTGTPGDYTLIATVTGTGAVPPTGTVSFLDTDNANYVLGTANLTVGASGLGLLDTSTAPTNADGLAITTADFNGDGIPDVADVSASGILTILLGNGDGTLSAGQSTPTGLVITGITTADFNGDGKADLAFGSFSNGSVYVLLGNGDGTFTTGPNLVTDDGIVASLAPADLNGDGIEDIVGVDAYKNRLFLLLGHGDGTFTELPTHPATGQNPIAVAIGDYNGDGELDLAVNYLFNASRQLGPVSLQIFLGNGDGTFTAAPDVPIGLGPEGVVTADFNGDGKLDLAVANLQPPATVEVFLGNGDGTFAAAVSSIPIDYLNSLAIGDFNGDKIPDIGTFEAVGTTAPQNVVALIGKGDGTFTPVSGSDPAVPNFGAIADFNRDGRDDIAVANETTGVTVMLSQLSGAATATVTHISPVGTGTHFVDASYPGDGSNLASLSTTLPLTAERVPTTLSLATNPATNLPAGQPVMLTTALAPHNAQNHEATGAISFSNNGTALGSSALASGAGALSTSALTTGTNNLAAQYPGDTNFLPSAATLAATASASGATTLTTLTCNPSVLSVNSTSLFSVTVSSASGTPTGTINFTDNGAALTQLTLANGAASYNFISRQSGTRTIVATCVPTGSFAASSASCVLTVSGFPTTATLSAFPTATTQGSPVTLTVSVSGGPPGFRGSPVGPVTFYNGSTVIASGLNLAQGTVSFTTTTLPPGIDYLTCLYNGNAAFAPATCNTVAVTITQSSAAITLTSSLNPAPALTPITFTAQVAPGSSGTIVFNINGQNFTTTPNASGQSTTTIGTLTPGSYLITATYYASASALAAQASLNQLVTVPVAAPDFSLTGTDTTFVINHKGTGKLLLASLGTFSGAVALTCDPPYPPGYTCTLQTSNVTLPLGFSTYVTYTLSPNYAATTEPTTRSTRLALAAVFPLSLFTLIGLARKRRTAMRTLLCLVALTTLASITTACGPDHFIPISVGTYPITFTGVGISQNAHTPITHTVTIQATIAP